MDIISSSLYDKLIAGAACVRPVEELVLEIQPVDEARRTQRTEALKKLVFLLKVWARMVVYQLGHPDKVVTQKHLKLVPFGSYKYDDTSKDSDIDLLCITSKYITRKHFFHDLCRLFEGMKEVEGFTVIMAAVVPIIKMKFRGVAMDICFSQLTCNYVPAKLTLDYIAALNIEATLRFTPLDLSHQRFDASSTFSLHIQKPFDVHEDQMDDKSTTSLNGYIMTAKIAEMVPHFHTFTTTLNTIKLWAKKRGVYSAVLGFLGGSSWSLLVAKICQLYPKATPTTLTSLFFQFYSSWDWTNPISLSLAHCPDRSQPLHPWIIPADTSRDVMQIMTPLHPSTNTSRNVSRSALRILRNEFRKGAKITQSSAAKTHGWRGLFADNTREFFSLYPVYVQVVVGALKDDGGAEVMRKWEGWTKSRIAGLVKTLEQQEGVEFAHLNTKQYVQKSSSISEPETMHLFIGLSMDDTLPHPLPCATTNQFVRYVSTWREFDPLRMGLRVDFVPIEVLPDFVSI